MTGRGGDWGKRRRGEEEMKRTGDRGIQISEIP